MSNKNLSFEQQLQRLEQIVRTMERGDAPLDESLKLFQEGTALISNCTKLLDDAELQVNQILANDQGAPVEEKFDHVDES